MEIDVNTQFDNNKELEQMIKALENQEKVRRAGYVDARGNISLSREDECVRDNNEINFSLNHVMEYYIYEYYFKPDAGVKCTEHPYARYFREYGDLCMEREKFKAAEASYKDAICWNPVDLDSILALAECYRALNMLERYMIVTRQAYRYCCTRATMARYYRNMGYYYTQKYKPEVARACYIYSNIYFHTENADNELAYIEKAVGNKTPDLSIKQMQEVFADYAIEPGPDPDTIGIIYRVGELMLEDKQYSLARDCFSICYDITQEQALEELLDELERV